MSAECRNAIGSSTTQARERTDVLVVGGGVVGATLACALGSAGIEVVVVDANDKPLPLSSPSTYSPRTLAPFDMRVSALNHSSRTIFKALKVWPKVPPQRITSYLNMRVWDIPNRGEIHFSASSLGTIDLGCIVENRQLLLALEARIAELPTVHWVRPAQIVDYAIVSAIGRDASEVHVETTGGSFVAKLLVGADGAHSRVRDLAGIGTTVRSYEQQAVVTTIKTEHSHLDTAWQRFLPSGPLALLPLPEGYGSIVWSADSDEAQRLSTLDKWSFHDALSCSFNGRLGRIEWSDQCITFPLSCLRVNSYIAHRVALVGDAAHIIHPLAGQGVNLGLLDASCLSEVLVTQSKAHGDLGVRGGLRRYERWRSGHNFIVQTAMDGFDWAFRHPGFWVRQSRNLGFRVVENCPLVKQGFMQQALGMPGSIGWELPQLARGEAFV